MRILCDAHIAPRIVHFFRQNGIESIHVSAILEGFRTPDELISSYADTYDFILLTKDNDFRNGYFLRSKPRKVIHIVLGNTSNNELIEALERYLPVLRNIFEKGNAFVELHKDSIYIVQKNYITE